MSNRKWVVNASPLILLGEIGHLSLLQELCVSLVIPDAVAREIGEGPHEDEAQRWLASDGHTYICEVQTVDTAVASWDLGAGENAVLTYGRSHPGYEAILDDRAARKCAEALRIPIRGTIGVLLLAKREGLIDQISPALDALVRAGMRITPELLQAALQLAGEENWSR